MPIKLSYPDTTKLPPGITGAVSLMDDCPKGRLKHPAHSARSLIVT
nr:hypothetical protein [Gammaproteobacteria bacterium]